MSLERGLFHYATLLLGLVGLLGTFGFLALLVVMTPASWPSVVIATISFAPFWAFMAFLPRFAWWVRVEGVDPESQPVTAYVGVINKWGAGSKALGRSLMGRMEGAS